MNVQADLIFLPYDAESKKTLVDILIDELRSDRWRQFHAAIAFARVSGNYRELLDALIDFAGRGGAIEITFGANQFADGEGSDYEAVETLLKELAEFPNAKLHLYSEPYRTFHPKLYLFVNGTTALLIVGSSNWTQGGLERNVEVNVSLHLNLEDPEQRAAFDRTLEVFQTYWREAS